MLAVIFLAPGFEEIEAITVIDILRRSDIDVKIVGVSGQYVTGAHGIVLKSDIDDSNFNIDYLDEKVDVVILPGGMPGTKNLEESKVVSRTIEMAAKDNIYIAAICAAPMILGNKGLLQDKKVACYPGFEKYLIGATVCQDSVCQSENFITAKGPGVAIDFALKIVETLAGKEKMDQIKQEMLY